MRYAKQPVTVKVGDAAAIKTQRTMYGSGSSVTVPKNYLLKLLASGQVRVFRDYRYTDDYVSDMADNFGKAELDPAGLLQDFQQWGTRSLDVYYREPWRDVHGKDRPASLRFGRHQAECFTLLPKRGTVEVVDR